MAKTRMYRKKGCKSMRKSKRNTRRIKRRGGNLPNMNDELYKNFTDTSQLGSK